MGRFGTNFRSEPPISEFEIEGKKYISSPLYGDKYGISVKRIAPACRKGVLVGVQKLLERPGNKLKAPSWFILDIPPTEHPGWNDYISRVMKQGPDGQLQSATFKLSERAAGYLKKFDEARMQVSHTKFRQGELAQMLGTHKSIVWRWTEIGEPGFGKLPRIKIPADKSDKSSGLTEGYYDTKDVRRYLLGELKDPTRKFKTIDDKTEETTQQDIAEDFGYFVYDKSKVYPIGYDGFMAWATENVYRNDKTLGRWVPFVPIQMQRDFYKNAWKLKEDGLLQNRFIRICRPRGDFKSFDAILLFLFRFFNMQREKILLAANSKEQSDYALYDEARDIVLNSPRLADTPGLEVKQKEIVLMSGKTEPFSKIKSIASKTGTLSNATCVVFSEIYKLADHSFIVELEGSIRAVPNAMSIIESTVSRVGTYYHRQYEASLETKADGTPKSPAMYFQYYCDKHYNPTMTEEELAQYKESFFPEEFRMFFRNRWGDAGDGLFSDMAIMMWGIAGFDGQFGPSERLKEALKEYLEAKRKFQQLIGAADVSSYQRTMMDIESKIIPMDAIYTLPATQEDLEKIKEVFKCSDLYIGMGLDRAEQLSNNADRSALVTTAKAFIDANNWYSFLLDLYLPSESALPLFQNRIIENTERYGMTNRVDVEKAQGKDLADWCTLHGYTGFLAPASYEYQMEIFRLMYRLTNDGLLKAPTVPIWINAEGEIQHSIPPAGVKDIIRMEAHAFEHTPALRDRRNGVFGSKFKKGSSHGRTKKGEAKDDTIYGWAHAITASNNGDITAGSMDIEYSKASVNRDVIGDWASGMTRRGM